MLKKIETGFTLIEILIAVSILLIGTSVVTALLGNLFKLKLQQQTQLNVYKSMSGLAAQLSGVAVCNAVMNPFVGQDLSSWANTEYKISQIAGSGLQLTVNSKAQQSNLNQDIRITGMGLDFAGDLPQSGQPSAYIWLNIDFTYTVANQSGPYDQKRILYQVSLDRAPKQKGVYLAGADPCIDFVALRNSIASQALCAYLGSTEHDGVCDLFFNQAIRQMACSMIIGTNLQSNDVLPGRYCESPL